MRSRSRKPPPPPATPIADLEEQCEVICNRVLNVETRRMAVSLLRKLSEERVYPPEEYSQRLDIHFRLNQLIKPPSTDDDDETEIF